MTIEDQRIIKALDKLTQEFSPDDIALLKEIMHKNHGSELELLMSLMNYTYKYLPVPVKQFVEDEEYLGLHGQVFPILLDDLETLFEGDYNEAILTGAIGWGKALSIDTAIPTKNGWSTMQDTQIGDLLFDKNGKVCTVTNVTPVMCGRTCYNVRFSDGSSIVADAEHQWLVSDWEERAKAARKNRDVIQQVVTTKELIHNIKYKHINNWAIELAKAIPLPDQELPIDPYVLGVWLGDGTSRDGRITCYDQELVDKVRILGYEVKEAPATPNRYTIIGLKVKLRDLGLIQNKHVPSLYLWSSIEQRTALLQGLMDTDGTIEPCGRVEFTNTNKNLSESVYTLAASLGHKPIWWEGTAKLYGKTCGTRYRVRFTPDTPVFYLPRKLNAQRVPGKQALRNRRRYIIGIDPVDSVPVKCIQVDSPTHTFLAGKSFIPTHNSTFAEIAICRMIYEVSCFKNPQKALGLMDGSVIAFINVSLSKESAKKVVFHGLKSKLLGSKYFREYFPITAPLAEELRLSDNVWVFPVASGEHSILGYNVLGGVMDEVNFMDVVENSKRAGGTNQLYDQADKLQKQLIRRMKSRYMKKGKLPGILLQISSSAYPDDYTERRILEAKDDPTIFVRRYSQWDTLPKDKYNPEKFQLSLGDILERPRIIACKEDLEHAEEKGFQIIEVPEDYRKDFEKNIDESIRDLAGLPTLTIHPFILYREKILEAMDRGQVELGLEHPFTKEVSTLRDGGVFIPEKLLIPKWKAKYEQEEDPELKENYKIIYNNLKQKPRFVHIDLARTTMAGISVGFVNDYKEVVRRNEEGQEFTTRMPVIVIEFMLRVMAPQYGEIEASYVRSLVHELRSYGYRIGKVTFDQYQSLESQHQFIEKGIDAGQVSADANHAVYNALKDSIYEDRLMTYWYEPAYWEIIRLEKNERTGKVDHPKSGCFTGDTRIALADGTCPTFEDLSNMYTEDEVFYVYSIDKDGIAIKPARNSRVTKQATEIVEILLDNYQTIQCTPEHLFMTLDQEWIEAQHLLPDVRLMPLYRSTSSKGGYADYERIYCPVRKERILTHQLAHGPVGEGNVIHHKDHNKRNNDPRNLEERSRGDHYSYHGTHNWENVKESMRKGHTEYYKDPNNRKAQRELIYSLMREGKIKVGRDKCAIADCDQLCNARGLCDMHYQRAKRAGTLPKLRAPNSRNHRILSVEKRKVDQPVYDITVPETQNFALATGVFVHNSKDVSDSMAGVCYLCVENAPHAPTPPPMLGKMDKSRSTLSEYRRVPKPEEENFDWLTD